MSPHRGRRTISDLLADARSGLRRLGPKEAAREVERGALLIDIRPLEQRRSDGELPGAVVIDRNVLEWRLDPASRWRIKQVVDYDQRVIVVCNEGYSSSLAAATLKELGLVNATDVVGGFQAWQKQGTD
jgi:rhodanese-related sulfurtransferase